MSLVLNEWAIGQEISDRIDLLRARYVNDSLVERIEHRIDADWSGDSAVFVRVILKNKSFLPEELYQLADKLRDDVRSLVHTDELGLHTYLNFVKQPPA